MMGEEGGVGAMKGMQNSDLAQPESNQRNLAQNRQEPRKHPGLFFSLRLCVFAREIIPFEKILVILQKIQS